MKWTVGTPAFGHIFGECQDTVFRGVHLVMTASDDNRDYVIQESATKKVICKFPRKGQCYEYLKRNYHP
jgi:hypothetical protein